MLFLRFCSYSPKKPKKLKNKQNSSLGVNIGAYLFSKILKKKQSAKKVGTPIWRSGANTAKTAQIGPQWRCRAPDGSAHLFFVTKNKYKIARAITSYANFPIFSIHSKFSSEFISPFYAVKILK